MAVTECHHCMYGVHTNERRQYIPANISTAATLTGFMSIDATCMSACDGNVNIAVYFVSESSPWPRAGTDMAGQPEVINFEH
jgi:hypothetical protein